MSEQMIDERPLVEPNCFNYRALDGRRPLDLIEEIVREWEANKPPAWWRFTIVSDEHPNEPYPHGVYAEGWDVKPWEMDPPGKEAPFNYPLMAVE